MGLVVQLCTLPWLGYIPDNLQEVPRAALVRLAGQSVPRDVGTVRASHEETSADPQ
ncbi:hypothetical protein [Nonomuraea rhodomycinica]|uniref:hypothetical protein n=1 Tax=Nonomuraea rhodomycinica TaxID=1712872 RepID=UPI0035E43F0E